MITAIEQAIVDRLSKGLGRVVRTVKSYGGELEGMEAAIRTLPACWVAFGGCQIEPAETRKYRYRHIGKFVVMVGTRSLRSDQSLRQGGIDVREIGSNDLIAAVVRLLASQSFDGLIFNGLTPEAVRAVYNNTYIGHAAASVFAVEFKAVWHSLALPDGRYPDLEDNVAAIDKWLVHAGGAQSTPLHDFDYLDAKIFDPNDADTAQVGLTMNMGNE